MTKHTSLKESYLSKMQWKVITLRDPPEVSKIVEICQCALET